MRTALVLAFAALLALTGYAAWKLSQLALDQRDSGEAVMVVVSCGSVSLVALWLAYLVGKQLRAA